MKNEDIWTISKAHEKIESLEYELVGINARIEYIDFLRRDFELQKESMIRRLGCIEKEIIEMQKIIRGENDENRND